MWSYWRRPSPHNVGNGLPHAKSLYGIRHGEAVPYQGQGANSHAGRGKKGVGHRRPHRGNRLFADSADRSVGLEYQMLLREPIAEREFPEWTLGFETVESVEAGRLLGKPLPFDSAARVAGIDAESAKTLLSIMGRRRWQSDRSGMFRAIRRTARSSAVS
jgi:hypothetical protein